MSQFRVSTDQALRGCGPKSNLSNFELPIIFDSRLRDQSLSDGTLSSNFDMYHVLAWAIYKLSNDFIPFSMSGEENLLEVLLERIPRGLFLQLFSTPLPTIRAAWVRSLCFVGPRNKDAFLTLMRAGLKNPEWIRSYGHVCLSYAASFGCLRSIQSLVFVGARPDTPLLPNMSACRRTLAILEALAAGSLEGAKLLILNCDANRKIPKSFYSCEMSNFQAFVEELIRDDPNKYWYVPYGQGLEHHKTAGLPFSLENDLHRQALDLFLENGADVDMPWNWLPMHLCGPSPGKRLSEIYEQDDIPSVWHITILEYCFHYNRATFRKLLPYSTKSVKEITRPGVWLALKRTEGSLHDYIKALETHPTAIKQFLELILAEEFLMEDSKIDTDIVLGLIKYGVDISIPSLSVEITDLLNAVIAQMPENRLDGHMTTVLSFIVSQEDAVNSKVLSNAVKRTNTTLLKSLVGHVRDLPREGALALATAAHSENYEAVEILLRMGVDINGYIPCQIYPNGPTESLSVIAVAASTLYRVDKEFNVTSFEMLQYLISRGAKLAVTPSDTNPIEFLQFFLTVTQLCDDSLLKKVSLFLENGLNLRDSSCYSAMLLESCCQVRRHVYIGAECNQRSHLQEVLELLVERGAPLQSGSPLALIIKKEEKKDLIHMLLDAGANIDAYSGDFEGYARWNGNKRRLSPLQAAAGTGNKVLVSLLLQRGAFADGPALGSCSRTALQAVCSWCPATAEESSRKMDIAGMLIHHGADVNAPPAEDYGFTALQIAAMLGDLDMAAFLLSHRAHVNALPARRRGRAALDSAAEWGRLDMAKFLLNAGALSHRRGFTGYDGAIRLAEKNHHFAIADLIREHITKDIQQCIINPYLAEEQDEDYYSDWSE